jgi:hypothetical protein
VRTLQAIERFHINGDFYDFAYNGAASNSSAEWAEGRGALTQGGATGAGVDAYSLSIVAIGSFHKSSDKRFHEPTDLLVDNTARLIVRWINSGYVSKTFTIEPHRNYYQTACCGDALAARISDIKARVSELLGESTTMIPMSEWDNHFNSLPDFNEKDGVVEWFQEGLINLGYLPAGSIDGVKGPQTRGAWQAFEVAQGYQNANDKPGNTSVAAFRAELAKIGDSVIVEVPVEVEVPTVPAGIATAAAHAQSDLDEIQRIIDTTG